MIESDDVLVAASRNRDRAAFEELVHRTARLVFARLYLDTADDHLAEDLAQETYLLAWQRIGQLSDAATFRPWLLSIAQSVRIDALRRQGRQKRPPAYARRGAEALAIVPDAAPLPPQALERQEARLRLLEHLRSLPEEYRMPLTLRYLDGADYETISRQLGLTNGSLRGLLHRGIAMLRSSLSQHSDGGQA